jgi:hypothetical protein
MKNFLAAVLCLIGIMGVLTGCNGSSPSVPSSLLPAFEPPGFHGLVVQGVTPDIGTHTLTLELGLKFRYINPLPHSNLPVLAHQFQLFLNDGTTAFLSSNMPAIVLTPGEKRDVIYPVKLVIKPDTINGFPAVAILNLPQIKYKFVASVNVDPVAGLPAVPARIVFEDSLVIPRLPMVSVDLSTPPSLKLTGTLKVIDLTGVNDNWKKVGNIVAGEPPAGDQDADAAATAVRAILNPLPGYGDFRNAWDKIKGMSLQMVDVVNSDVTGFELDIPLIISNPNAFKIKAPLVNASLANGPDSITSLSVQYGPSNEVPAATPGANANLPLNPGTARATLTMIVHWNKLPSPAAALTDLAQLNGANASGGTVGNLMMNADITLDLGYGPVHIPVSAPVSLKLTH